MRSSSTELVREADDRGDWQAAGCSSSAQWFAQVSSSDYRTAVQITQTSDALRDLPELDQALGEGVLTLDQVSAATRHATPETDAQLARVAVGKAPSAIALVARTLNPPTVAEDKELYERRALSMNWSPGRRELLLSGRLPLEQGVAFEQAIWDIAKPQRALDKQAGSVLEWQQYTADALVTLARESAAATAGGMRRSATTLIVHLSEDAPPMLEGAGPLSPETAELAHLRRAPPHHPADAGVISCTHASDAARPTRRCARSTSAQAATASTPAAPPPASSKPTTSLAYERGGATELDNLILLCSRHHKHLHDHHIHTSGTGEQPVFTDPSGRAITTNQPHAPPR